MTGTDVEVWRRDGARSEGFRERALRLQGQVRADDEGRHVEVPRLELAAGRTATGDVRALTVHRKASHTEVVGGGTLTLDLASLGRLRHLVPALEPLAGGTLEAVLRGEATNAAQTNVGVGLDVTNLVVHPCDWAPVGHRERSANVAARILHAEADGTRVRIHRIRSSIAWSGALLWKEPFEVGMQGEDMRMHGPLDFTVDMPPSRAGCRRARWLEPIASAIRRWPWRCATASRDWPSQPR